MSLRVALSKPDLESLQPEVIRELARAICASLSSLRPFDVAREWRLEALSAKGSRLLGLFYVVHEVITSLAGAARDGRCPPAVAREFNYEVLQRTVSTLVQSPPNEKTHRHLRNILDPNGPWAAVGYPVDELTRLVAIVNDSAPPHPTASAAAQPTAPLPSSVALPPLPLAAEVWPDAERMAPLVSTLAAAAADAERELTAQTAAAASDDPDAAAELATYSRTAVAPLMAVAATIAAKWAGGVVALGNVAARAQLRHDALAALLARVGGAPVAAPPAAPPAPAVPTAPRIAECVYAEKPINSIAAACAALIECDMPC